MAPPADAPRPSPSEAPTAAPQGELKPTGPATVIPAPGKGFHPLATPPLGSAGDAWDGFIEFPPQAKPAAARPARRRKARKGGLYGGIRHKLLISVPIGWVAVALGATTPPPLALLQAAFAVVALGCAAATFLMLPHRPFTRGRFHAVGLIVAAGCLLMWFFARGFLLDRGWPLLDGW